MLSLLAAGGAACSRAFAWVKSHPNLVGLPLGILLGSLVLHCACSGRGSKVDEKIVDTSKAHAVSTAATVMTQVAQTAKHVKTTRERTTTRTDARGKPVVTVERETRSEVVDSATQAVSRSKESSSLDSASKRETERHTETNTLPSWHVGAVALLPVSAPLQPAFGVGVEHRIGQSPLSAGGLILYTPATHAVAVGASISISF